MSIASTYLASLVKRLEASRDLGTQTFAQLSEDDLHFRPEPGSNSIAVIIRHLHGNMRSRFTDFLTEDGEKSWRERDEEFSDTHTSKTDLLGLWEEGWSCVLKAVKDLSEPDLERTITIRGEPHAVVDALNRNLSHTSYHVGQIVYLGKVIRAGEWKNLSVPLGQSKQHTQATRQKFGQP